MLLSQGANKLQMSESELYDIITDSVKRERKKRGISQLKLALILGHQSASYVARIELRQDAVNYKRPNSKFKILNSLKLAMQVVVRVPNQLRIHPLPEVQKHNIALPLFHLVYTNQSKFYYHFFSQGQMHHGSFQQKYL